MGSKQQLNNKLTFDQAIRIAHLIAQDCTLFLDGLASLSIKEIGRTPFGKDEQLLWVNRTGSRLAGLERDDFIALRIRPLLEMVEGEVITNIQIANALLYSRTNQKSSYPPLEAILHIVIPASIVLFVQPIEVQAISSTPAGYQRLQDLYQGWAEIIPFQSTIYNTALACREVSQSESGGSIILPNRGVLIFGRSAQEVVNSLNTLVDRAGRLSIEESQTVGSRNKIDLISTSERRLFLSKIAGFPLLVRDVTQDCGFLVRSAGGAEEVRKYWPSYPALAKIFNGLPMADVEIEEKSKLSDEKIDNLDFASHLILTQDSDVYLTGKRSIDLIQLQTQFQHHLLILLRAKSIDQYRSLSEEIFLDIENFHPLLEIEEHSQYPFEGEIALVTGGASGIGKACVEALLNRGAAVVSLDINSKVMDLYDKPDYLGWQCDLTNEKAIKEAFSEVVHRFGGLDMLVLNAGIFPGGCRIENMSMEEWHKVMRINLDSNLSLLREAHPLLKRAPRYGRIVINGSKNVLAPGNGAVAYSSSKAALTQMARVAALEWGKDGIRVNVIHPDAVFDTGLWTDEVLKARAAHYGITVQQYKTRNILGIEMTSRNVGEMIAEMLGPLYEKVTGMQVVMDGGSDRII